jgi:Uma2 family endonuclease
MATTLSRAPAAAEPVIAETALYRLSVAQYDAMARAGILTSDDPVQLLEGLLVRKMTKNQPHVVASMLLSRRLAQLLPDGWCLATEAPVFIEDSLPEPDAVILRGDPRDFSERRPEPSDVGLIIEVSDSSLGDDASRKKRIYARAGIPIYWIVSLKNRRRRIEVYTDPVGGARPTYRQRRDYQTGDSVPLVLAGVIAGELAVAEILP